MPDVGRPSNRKAGAKAGRDGDLPRAEHAPSPAGSIFPRCGNPACATSWMHLWRNRRVPVFEGRWACSPECMRALVATALRRERSGGVSAEPRWTHRVPVGLLLVEQGQITDWQLRCALEQWRRRERDSADGIRLGQWLIESGLLSETALTRALSVQWSCPALSLAHYRPEETAAVMPRILVEAFGALPVRTMAGRRVSLAFCGALDRSLSYAVERATGLRVTAGMAGDREFRRAQAEYLATPGPGIRCLQAGDPSGLIRAIAARIEQEKPVESRLVRVHKDYWLRLWRCLAPEPGLAGRKDVEDVLCVPGSAGAQNDC